jgi:hypothetical protein
MYNTIAQLMKYRPDRGMAKTQVLYLWSATGWGKTTMIQRILEMLKEKNIADFYIKMGGLSKYWDGYDNEPICWIDDPVTTPDPCKNQEEVQSLKNVMSAGNCLVEIKHGSLIFDSELVIITSNIPDYILAEFCGTINRGPILRRLRDTCGSYYLDNVDDRDYWTGTILNIIVKAIGSNVNTSNLINEIIEIPEEINYDQYL